MEREFVNFKQALALKELGFYEPCLGRWLEVTEWEEPIGEIKLQIGVKAEDYDKNQCSAPLKQQIFRWFRDEYKIETVVACFYSKRLEISYEERQYHCHIVRDGVTTKGPKFKNYEEAESSCIDKLIEIVKNK